MARQTTLDPFGRVVIPKSVRVRLGLEAGAVLEVDESDDTIVLRPVSDEAPLRREGGVLVFGGVALAPLEDAVGRLRGERQARLGRLRP
jgi:AbrB family looped-hinge helix DNA binding protein